MTLVGLCWFVLVLLTVKLTVNSQPQGSCCGRFGRFTSRASLRRGSALDSLWLILKTILLPLESYLKTVLWLILKTNMWLTWKQFCDWSWKQFCCHLNLTWKQFCDWSWKQFWCHLNLTWKQFCDWSWKQFCDWSWKQFCDWKQFFCHLNLEAHSTKHVRVPKIPFGAPVSPLSDQL
jgi:hypothetical protein